jgi:hypothetical protein
MLEDLSKQKIVEIQLGEKKLKCLKLTFGGYIKYSTVVVKSGFAEAVAETLPLLVLAENFGLTEQNEALIKEHIFAIQGITDEQFTDAVRLLGFFDENKTKKEDSKKK